MGMSFISLILVMLRLGLSTADLLADVKCEEDPLGYVVPDPTYCDRYVCNLFFISWTMFYISGILSVVLVEEAPSSCVLLARLLTFRQGSVRWRIRWTAPPGR